LLESPRVFERESQEVLGNLLALATSLCVSDFSAACLVLHHVHKENFI
jgi:hypothetical protein